MAIKWLLDNAGAVVRYRTQVELIKNDDKGLLQESLADVLSLPQVQKRLSLLENLDFNRVHGSDSTHLENVLPMLSDFGLCYDIDAFRNAVKNNAGMVKSVFDYTGYNKTQAYPFLLKTKIPINGLLEFAVERINTIYKFTQHMNYEIYDDAANHKGVPKPFRDRPIIKPSVAYGDMCRLPLIYDIVTMAEVYDRVPIDIQRKIESIIDYVISPGYDSVVFGYGILAAPGKKYYSMGWDCKKPFNDTQENTYRNLHRLLLYSAFHSITKSMWFLNTVDYLMRYKTDNGTYVFPKEYLVEQDSNWVLGSHMSLAENRRTKQWAEVESTFYMLKLIKCVK